ncbi:MAG TPA: hypothetical protein VGS41_17205, partial [Chthonomonadales bacterium]|nr:hypothetical protein [Chthonomonadales bacterium]
MAVSARTGRVRFQHVAASGIVESAQPRTWQDWTLSAADAVGMIPLLNVPAEIVSGSVSLIEGDLIGFGLSL